MCFVDSGYRLDDMYSITCSQWNGHNFVSKFTDLDQSAHTSTLTKYIENIVCY